MSSAPPVEAYPGNPSLPREVREKILSTFRHTLNLFNQGKTDDCVIGCDFILKMDPRFAPARKLMEKAKNPNAEINVAELEALVTATPTRQERVAAADPERLLVRAVESYNARDFDAATSAAQQVLAVLPGNRDALEILDKAAGKKAAQPLFDASRQRALAALEASRPDAARQELDRMRGLDPDHPAVALLERRLGGGPAAPTPARPAAPPPRPPAATPMPPPGPTVGTPEELSFDLSSPEPPQVGPGAKTQEPQIHFDSGATVSINLGAAAPPPSQPAAPGLDALSLDSLSLDLPPAPAPPPARPPALDMDATNPGAMRAAAPAAPPGSPADFWTKGPETPALEAALPELPPMVPVAPVAPPPAAVAPPAPAAPAPTEEEEASANQREIETLLHQGDDMVRRGDRQQAIEIWSRIFLIDINNAEAVNRIEKARQEMSEGNRTISDSLKSGREKFEAGDYSAARELFLQVLAIDENEPTARFYMDRIEEELTRGRAAAQPSSLESDFGTTPAVAAGTAAGAEQLPRRRSGLPIPSKALALIAVALIASAAGVYFFVVKSPGKSPSRPTRATQGTGQPRKARAVAGEAAQPAGSAPSVVAIPSTPAPNAALPATPGPNDPARLRTAGEKALAEKHYIEALKNFNLASSAFRNDPTFAQSLGVASDKVAVLAPAVKLYNEAEYETAIPVLWRIYQEDRENQDARSYLLRCYYNEGVTQLQNGLFPKAMKSFDEALALDPNDAEIIRNRKFAEHYEKGDLDLMGQIYVRHLNRRP